MHKVYFMRSLAKRRLMPPQESEKRLLKPWELKHSRTANRLIVSLPKEVGVAARLILGEAGKGISEEVYQKSIKMLRSLPEGSDERKKATAYFTTALLHHPKGIIRKRAAIVFGDIGSSSGVPALKAALKNDPNIDVRGISAYSLAHIGTPETVPALKELLCDGNAMVRMLSEDSYNRYVKCITKGPNDTLRCIVPDAEIIPFFREELAKVWGSF
jgi:hypothetical protein